MLFRSLHQLLLHHRHRIGPLGDLARTQHHDVDGLVGQRKLQGYATATDLADYLVKRGLPFRDAHEAVAHAVRACDDLRCDLADLSVAQLRDICGLGDKSDLIADDVHAVLTLEGSVASRNHIGGTAPEQVKQAIAFARAALAE